MKKTTPPTVQQNSSDLVQLLLETQSSGTTRGGEAVLFSSATWTPANHDNQAFYTQIQEVCRSFQPGTVYDLETALPGLIKQMVRAIISSGSSREKLLQTIEEKNVSTIARAIISSGPSSEKPSPQAFAEAYAIARLSEGLSQLTAPQLVAIEQRAPGTILTLAQCAAFKTGHLLDAISETLLAFTDWEAFTPDNTLNTMIWLVKASQKDPNCPNLQAITLHACSLLTRDHFNSLVEKMPDLILMLFEMAQHDKPEFRLTRTTAETMLARVFTAYIDLGHEKWFHMQQKSPGMMNSILSYLLYVGDASSSYNSGVTFVHSYLQASHRDELIILAKNHTNTLTSFAIMGKQEKDILTLLTVKLKSLPSSHFMYLHISNLSFCNRLADAAVAHKVQYPLLWIRDQLDNLVTDCLFDDDDETKNHEKQLLTSEELSIIHRTNPHTIPTIRTLTLLLYQHDIPLVSIEAKSPRFLMLTLSFKHKNESLETPLFCVDMLNTMSPEGLKTLLQRAPGTIHALVERILSYYDAPDAVDNTQRLPLIMDKLVDMLTKHPDFYSIGIQSPGTFTALSKTAIYYPAMLDLITNCLANLEPYKLSALAQQDPFFLQHFVDAACDHQHRDAHAWVAARLSGFNKTTTSGDFRDLERNAPGTTMHLFTAACSSEGKRLLPVLADFLKVHKDSIKLYATEKGAPGTIKSIAAIIKTHRHPDAYRILSELSRLLTQAPILGRALEIEQRAPGTIKQFALAASKNDADILQSMSTEQSGTWVYQAPIDAMAHPDLMGTLSYQDWLEIERNTPKTMKKIAYCATLGHPSALQQLVSKLADAPSDTLLSLEERAPNTINSLLHNARKKNRLATSILALFASVGHDFTPDNLFTIETAAPGTLASLAHVSMRNNPSFFWAITPKLAQLSPEQLYPLICNPQAPETLRKLVQSLDESQSIFALTLALCIDNCFSPNDILTLEASPFGEGTVATLANSAMSNNFSVLWEAWANQLLQLSPEDLQAVESDHANTLSSIRDAAEHFHELSVSTDILHAFSQLLPQPAVNSTGPAADAIRFFGSTPFDMEGLEDQSQPASSHSP